MDVLLFFSVTRIKEKKQFPFLLIIHSFPQLSSFLQPSPPAALISVQEIHSPSFFQGLFNSTHRNQPPRLLKGAPGSVGDCWEGRAVLQSHRSSTCLSHAPTGRRCPSHGERELFNPGEVTHEDTRGMHVLSTLPCFITCPSLELSSPL